MPYRRSYRRGPVRFSRNRRELFRRALPRRVGRLEQVAIRIRNRVRQRLGDRIRVGIKRFATQALRNLYRSGKAHKSFSVPYH